MANYRQIHVNIWKDEWFLDLDPNEKLLFIYLFSNESASLAGIYKIALKVIAFETGLDRDFVKTTMTKFEECGKVVYRDGIVWIKNLRKYNQGSAKVDIRIQKDIDEIPDCQLKQDYIRYYDEEIPYPYPIDTISTEMKCNEMNTIKDMAAEPPNPPKKPNIRSDPRTKHPAILCLHGITGKYPPKELFDNLIGLLGETPDGKKLADNRQEWVKRGYNPNAWTWALEWYTSGIPPKFSRNGNSPPKPRKQPEMTPEEIAAELAKGKST